MKGKIEALTLKEFSNIFRRLEISDIRVEIRDDGWYVAAVDPGHIMIAEVLLSKDAWEEYDFAPKTFAIDVDRLYKFAGNFKKGEILEVSFEDTRELECCFYLNGTLTRTFKLLEEESLRTNPTIPALEFKSEITLLAPQLELIKSVLSTKLEDELGNEIGIGIVERTPGEYELCAFAEDDGGIKSKRCVSLERATNYLVIEPCASIYSINLFKSIFALITKEVGATGTVTIRFAFQYPLKLTYEHKGIEAMILLAPRIDEEEGLKESDVYEELRTPFKPIEEVVEEVEIESTATTLYFLPTAKGRLLKPFKRTEYSDVELIDILLEKHLPEIEGILSHLKLEAIWKETSYGKYSAIVKEEEISREPVDIDAIIKIVENYKLMKYPYLEIREYYKHPETLVEKPKEEPWRRLMDVLKELEKEHGLEVPEDIAIAAATEVGIEKPEDLIGELKRDGILYSPEKGLIARVEKEEKIQEEPIEEEMTLDEITLKKVKEKILFWIHSEEQRENTCDFDIETFVKLVTVHTTFTPAFFRRAIDELKAEGVLYSPREGVIRRTECKEPVEKKEQIELKTEEVRRLIKKFPHVTVDEWEKLEEKICVNIGKAERVLKDEYHELLRETCKHIEKIREDIKKAEDVYKAPVKPTTHEEKKKALERAVEEFKQKIVDWYGSLYLIGSVLREEDTIYSDVDVLLSHHATTEQREEIEKITKIILQDTGVLISFAPFAFLPTDVPTYPVKLLAEIKKPPEVPIEEEDKCRWECDKQFKICIEGREADKEFCYEDCEREYEDKDSEDYKRCIKKCDKEYEEGVEWCEKEGAECYEECERKEAVEEIKVMEEIKPPEKVRIIEKSSYKGYPLYFIETFRKSPAFSTPKDNKIYVDKEFYDIASRDIQEWVLEHEIKELKGIPHKEIVKAEDPKIREEGTRLWVSTVVNRIKKNPELKEEAFKLWGDMAYILEEELAEKVKIHGILKTRYRCPVCYRAAPENFCMVHSDVEAIDLLAADEPIKEAVIDLTFLDLFKTKYPEKKRWTIDELHDAIGIDTVYAPEFLAKPRLPETYAQYYARELGVEIEEIKPPEVVKPPVEERTETQEMIFEYFKKEIDEIGVDAYQRGYLDALHREIGREFTVDHLLLADSEELYRLMDLKREELEEELKRRLTPVPPSVEELAETERLEILRKMRKYKKVEAEVPELKIGAKVKMNDKEGVLVDVSANKYRVDWDDGTWDWITQKDSEFIVVY